MSEALRSRDSVRDSFLLQFDLPAATWQVAAIAELLRLPATQVLTKEPLPLPPSEWRPPVTVPDRHY